MVGIVVVSHSPDLARAAVSLALEMLQGTAPRVEIAAGTSDDRLGTDAARVAEAIVAADDGEGVVVLPAALVEEIAADSVKQEIEEEWALERVTAGDSTVGTKARLTPNGLNSMVI